jgi:hypothetical protein
MKTNIRILENLSSFSKFQKIDYSASTQAVRLKFTFLAKEPTVSLGGAIRYRVNL